MSRVEGIDMDGMTEEVGYLLKEVQQDLRKRMDRALVELNLTTPQYSVLSELHGFPGLSNAELARKSFVTPQTMNLIIQNLEARGLVGRSPSASHGKIIKTITRLNYLKLTFFSLFLYALN